MPAPTVSLNSLSWALTDLGHALQELASAARLVPLATEVPRPPEAIGTAGQEAIGRWIDRAAGVLGLESEPVECEYRQLETFVRKAGPALLQVHIDGVLCFLALLRGRGPWVWLVGPDLKVVRVPAESLRAIMCGEREAKSREHSRSRLEAAGLQGERLEKAVDVLMRQLLSAQVVGNAWFIRLPPGASFSRQLRLVRLPRLVGTLVAVFIISNMLWIGAWWMVGKAALQGHVDVGWLVVWALLLLVIVPFQALGTWLQGKVSISFGGLLKQRLLVGALKLDPDEIRSMGSGQMLGRVIEADALEGLALSGGMLSVVAVVEACIAAAVLGAGAGGVWHGVFLIGWLLLTLFLGWRYYLRRKRWTATRLDLTHELVERMVGQRTRLVQEAPGRWHEAEDDAVQRYLVDSQGMDIAMARLLALLPRGCVVVGLLGLAPGFILGTASPASLAIGFGGLILSFRALGRLVHGLSSLADAGTSWQQVGPLFHSAARPQEIGSPEFAVSRDMAVIRPEATERSILAELAHTPPVRAPALLEVHDLTYRYGHRPEPVLRGCSVKVERGDRVLLGGGSGGGKSTLATLIAGVRHPSAGLLMLDGLDRQTLGQDGWRHSIVMAPQFHENHVMGATFSFNLLMGRRWPPTWDDMVEAEVVCNELGLGPLLQRMPGGLLQMVGESGWQLSHGERSRLFIARTLLQGADLIILDESLAALDPQTMAQTMQCVLKRASTLIVIAHP